MNAASQSLDVIVLFREVVRSLVLMSKHTESGGTSSIDTLTF